MTRRLTAALSAVLVLTLLGGCTESRSEGEATDLVTDLEVPWGLAFLPDGDALVGERDTGRVLLVSEDGASSSEVATVPGVDPGGEGGLLGLAVSPTYIHDSLLYAYITTSEDNRIIRFRLAPDGTEVYNVQVVLSGIAKGGQHNGGGLAFGPDGMLYAGTGDADQTDRAQDTGEPERQDPADDTRRGARPGTQPDAGLGRLHAGAPQRAGPGLGQQRPAVGHRVRPGRLRRGEPDRARAATTGGRRSKVRVTPTTAGSPTRR